jgi:hypothetical protein
MNFIATYFGSIHPLARGPRLFGNMDPAALIAHWKHLVPELF